MSTEDDLRRLGQAAAALAGVAAARAKQVAEQLLGPRERAREEARHRAGGFVEEGRHAAADVVSALRREASIILRDLEHLEQSLRAREGDAPGPTTEPAPPRRTETSAATAPAKKSAPPAKAAPRKATGAKAPGGEAAGPKAAGAKAAKKTASQAKSGSGRKSAGAKSAGTPKTTGGPSSSTEGQG
jgi:hypothetical protein